jgi:ribosomal protein S13
MSKIIRIYCEGKKGSHDYDILEKVIEGLSIVQIDPIGSIRGAGAIIQYKEKGVVKSDFKILFRDRDFDKPIPKNAILEQDNTREYCYYSYRNTIENYLFDTSIFFAFLKQNGLCEKYSISSEMDVKNKFVDAARKIKCYQAIRHTMGKMRTGETNFGTKWTAKSGKLPERLDEEFCKNEAWRKIEKAKLLADSWTEDNFLKVYQYFIDIFNEDFINDLHFLIYFQGKDFASSLNSLLPTFPLKGYYKFAKEHFDYRAFPDLVQLRGLIETNL